MSHILMVCLACTALTYFLAHVYRLVARAYIIDSPNHRSAHEHSTVTGAGVSFIAVSLLAPFLVMNCESISGLSEMLFRVTPALLVVALVGFVDDYRSLSWKLRFGVHAACCAYVVWVTGVPELNLMGIQVGLGWLGPVLSFVGLIWLLNLYNFMDGIDGLAIGEASIVLAIALGMSAFLQGQDLPLPVILLLSSCVGFLVINWPRARVFMGDAGSGFLGLAFGVLILTEALLPIWTWLILLGWFITDSGITILHRFYRGEKIYQAHSQHAYQHLNRAVGTRSTLLMIMACNVFWLLPIAFWSATNEDLGVILLGLAYAPLIIVQYYCGAGQSTPKFLSGRGK